MSSQSPINLKSFPLIKVISSLLFIVGAVLAYLIASEPDFKLYQIGGIELNLILGVFPLLTGVVLILYAFITNYSVDLEIKDDILNIKSKKNKISLKKEDIKGVRVRDAGKSWIWFIFIFITYYFLYLGIECALYFSANHNTGLMEFILIPIIMIWAAGLILVLFPRKLIIILTKEKAIIQKVNHLPKNNSFERLFDDVFNQQTSKEVNFIKTNKYLYRLTLGIIFIALLIGTSYLVDIGGIVQPLHDLGVFIPHFLLLFGVLMVSSALSFGIKQNLQINDKIIRIEEKTLITRITGKNLSWIKAKEKVEKDKILKNSFRSLTKFDMMMIFVIFGQAFYLAFKIIWLPQVFVNYINIFDILIGILMLIVLFFYEFEIVSKINVDIDSDFCFPREFITPMQSERGSYISNFKNLLKTDFKKQASKVGIASIAALLIVTLSLRFLGFVFFIFI